MSAFYRLEHVELRPIHRWLESKLRLIEFDLDLAHSIIRTLQPDDDAKISRREYRAILRGSCQRFADGELYLTCDRFGRVHTPLTSLAKPLRCCLSVDGETLVGLDLANSQPLIAGICARQFFNSAKGRQRLLQRSFNNQANPYRFRQSIKEARPKRLGVERYIALCEDGLFYESLMQEGDDRDRFKQRFYPNVFFGENHWRSSLKERFEHRHPEVAEMLRKMKRKEYQRSAWLLQNIEAMLFIDCIANRIRSERQELPLFTIHDCLLTVPQDIDYLASVIRDEFAKLSVDPTLKKETYNENHHRHSR